jgi:hypothetical protein
MIEFLVIGLLALSVVCLWLLIEGRKNPKFLAWFIPLLLILITSTYVTYTSVLGYPKAERPVEGVYLKHYVDEPNWIYLWIVNKDNIPKSFQIPYSKGTHRSLEGVEGKAEEGKYMVLGTSAINKGSFGEETKGDSADGFTIGGNINFYEWDHESSMQPKE